MKNEVSLLEKVLEEMKQKEKQETKKPKTKKPEPKKPQPQPDSVIESESLSKKVKVLYYNTDRTCSMLNVKIEGDGSVKIGEKLFDFVEGEPSILYLDKKKYPFYILKHDNMKPLSINRYPSSRPTPEEASRLVNLKTLETLSQITGAKLQKGPLIVLMIVSFVIGFVTKIILHLAGVW